ncbi:MAG: glycosyltransferase [Methylomicrobium sp.]|nr:glycosyltransferase [Methylomicrobium sp.]
MNRPDGCLTQALKIVQVMLSKGFGGAERYFVDLSLSLAQAGHNVLVICHKDFVGYERFAGQSNIQVHGISVMGHWDPIASWRMAAIIKAFQPDVVQAHLARGAFIAGKALRRLNVPLVVKTHNYVNLKYYNSIDHFITTTQDQRKYLLEQGIEDSHISVIANFSCLESVKQASKQISEQPVFLSLGRFVKKKGFDVLLEAFQAYLQQGRRGRLVVGGDGPEADSLNRQCEALGLSESVEFCGWVEDVGAFLNTGDVFVLPSLDEPFGIAVLEAMACGLPIIATRTQGPLEILSDDLAYLVPIGDSVAIASAMSEIIDHFDAAYAKASSALNVYRDNYYKSSILPQLISLYVYLKDRPT